ncbi:PD-(D/E)XK nuclease-like domain-containing protein [Pectobacterium sp. 21LCBS03]|uniref:PD-(D/E)XK nuclease-like domain-containing protein n=1 Tax=Pectobacterium sp. 21LCBS03 TaxID=2935858 RepID=UPI00200CABFE|nr:PD-(D/E)XK nuclease-like domain-containing protein [Pectobacterium sp. 21LCBS03]UPY96240.1 PD-(D/E)XK nuclease-like domain-containing protein [Pectobacterium sp. 21LCBS03]
MTPGIYYDIPNETYHAADGVSKSQLDMVAQSPALLKWQRTAPVDEEKLRALDMGSALHCLLLEPDEFKNRFIVAPPFNRRTTAGKEAEAKFLADCASTGKTVMDNEDGRKLELMRGSAFAHPAARWLLESDGYNEASIYWQDEETEELCRVRPDRYLKDRPVIVDVKKVADMERFARHIEEFRYHVQDAMYSDGFYQHFNEHPTFVFIAVSETIDCGRYPVRVFELEDDDKATGHELYRRDLAAYHNARTSRNWGGIEKITRPAWAKRKERNYE